MSQPLFDPLDAAVLTSGLVPWASGIVAGEASARQKEFVQCTNDADPWTWHGLRDPGELTLIAREARREYLSTAYRSLADRVRAMLRGLASQAPTPLPHGERS